MGILPYPATFSCSQLAPELGPEARATKPAKVIIDCLPRREVSGQIAPGTAGAQEIEERIEDATERVPPESGMRRAGGEESLESVPLDIGEIAWVE
jgi:hypothetical protein